VILSIDLALSELPAVSQISAAEIEVRQRTSKSLPFSCITPAVYGEATYERRDAAEVQQRPV
jgi:hypothetical protein